MVFTTALLYPYSKVSRLVYTVLLLLVPFVNLVSGMWVWGYLLHVANAARRGDDVLPVFAKPLFVPGLKVFVISLIYAIPLWLVSLVSLVNTVLGTVLVALVSVLVYYMSMIAIVHFAAEGRFAAAFEFGQILRRAASVPFLMAAIGSLAMIVLYVLLAYLLTILTAVTVVGPYVVLIVAVSAALLSVMFLFGRAYGNLSTSAPLYDPTLYTPASLGVKGRKRV